MKVLDELDKAMKRLKRLREAKTDNEQMRILKELTEEDVTKE